MTFLKIVLNMYMTKFSANRQHLELPIQNTTKYLNQTRQLLTSDQMKSTAVIRRLKLTTKYYIWSFNPASLQRVKSDRWNLFTFSYNKTLYYSTIRNTSQLVIIWIFTFQRFKCQPKLRLFSVFLSRLESHKEF